MMETSKYLVASPGKTKTSDIELFSMIKESLEGIEIKIEEFYSKREEAIETGMIQTVEDMLINDIRGLTRGFKEYSSRRYLELNEDRELIGNLKEQIRNLETRNKELESKEKELEDTRKELESNEKELEDTRKELEEKNSQIENLGRQLREALEREKAEKSNSDKVLSEMYDRMTTFMELVESSAKTMAVVKRAKDKNIKTALRTDVSNETLINLYKEHDNLVNVAKIVNMTPNGVRARLENLGVYKSKRKDYGISRTRG